MDIDQKVITGLFAAVSAITGAVITAIAKGYTSRQKLNELRFEYENRLQDGYLEKAREYTKGIYVPLSISLTKLDFAYRNFRASTTDTKTELLGLFMKEVDAFVLSVSKLSEQGANAFLTTDLDTSLQGFCSFLASSKTAKDVQLKVVLRFGLSSWWGRSNFEKETVVSGRLARFLRSVPLEFSMGYAGFSYKGNDTVAAPPDTEEFQNRFVRDSHLINILIKEVTLGAKARK
jgi:hypothetical protein